MKRLFCDHCGIEVTNNLHGSGRVGSHEVVMQQGPLDKTYHLCDEHKKNLLTWLSPPVIGDFPTG